MFKIGILGAENSHASGFSQIINGFRGLGFLLVLSLSAFQLFVGNHLNTTKKSLMIPCMV